MRRLLLVIAIIGCGDNPPVAGGDADQDAAPPRPLQISSLDDVEIARLVAAAYGDDMFIATKIESFQTYSGRPDHCPSIVIDPLVGIATNNCCLSNPPPTIWASVCFYGSAEIENPRSWSGIVNDTAMPTRYTLHALEVRRVHLGTFYSKFDGTVQIENGTWTSSMVSGYGPATYPNEPLLESDMAYRCDESMTVCDLAGTRLLWAGESVDVSGTVQWASFPTTSTGQLTLRGVDTLTATVDIGCAIAWRLDSGRTGTARCGGLVSDPWR